MPKAKKKKVFGPKRLIIIVICLVFVSVYISFGNAVPALYSPIANLIKIFPQPIPPKLINTVPVCDVDFLTEELLTNPTQTSVTLSLRPEIDADIFVEYGKTSRRYTDQTGVQSVNGWERADFVLTDLEPGTKYYYRVKCKEPQDFSFGNRAEYTFHTLRPEGETLKFAVFTDSHLYPNWANADCGTSDHEPYRIFAKTAENMLAHDVNFFFATGDEAMTHSASFFQNCHVNSVSGGGGTVTNQDQADARYRMYLSPEGIGELTKTLPFFYALGNHDGETGFYGSCFHNPGTPVLSTNARLEYIPNPATTNTGGNPEGTYFSFESGDTLFVILDSYRYTMLTPQTPEDWTLGATQLQWLEDTLEKSDAKWKFVFSHHLIGGANRMHCYDYGSGGIRSTTDNSSRSPFSGEQQQIQELMEEHGGSEGTAYVYGHDHTAIVGEKLNEKGEGSGVHYIMTGQASSNPPPGSGDEGWRAIHMDWDEDGVVDYNEDPATSASREKGFFLVTVENTTTTFEYIGSSMDPAENGKVLFTYVIDGS